MKHLTWNGAGLLSASLLLGMLGGCGDNANDVGVFDEVPGTGGSGATGEVSNNDGSNSSSTDAGETEGTSSGVGGNGQSDAGTGGAASGGASAATDAGTDATGGAPSMSTGAGASGGTTGSGGSTIGSGGTATGSGGTTIGSGGTATGSGGTTTGSGGSGGGDACPLERPADDSRCEPNQLECTYTDECAEVTLVCTEGHWTRRANEARICASFTRETFPQDGDSCACTPELRCEFLDCDGRGRILAQCNGDTWQVKSEPCEVRPCGPVTGEQPRCGSDQICVVTTVGVAGVYTCQDNPCAEANLPNSCECARSVCPGDAFECNMHDSDTVLECTCRDCQ